MSKLNLRKALPISAVLAAFCALPAVAGSSYTENSYNLRNITNGRSVTNINVTDVKNTWGEGGSYNSKEGTSSTSVYQSTRTDAPGEWTSSTLSEQDSFDITATSFTKERFDGTTKTNVSVTDAYDYAGTDKTHRTTSGFDF